MEKERENLIRVENLSFGFRAKDLYKDVSFKLEAGQHCALIGSNGTGKSTLVEILTDPTELHAVRDALEAKGYSFESAEVQYLPTTTTDITDEDQLAKMERLLDMLDDNDDVQNVWHNWNAPEEEDED